MSYDGETERPRRRQSRGQQPVKRSVDKQTVPGKNKRPQYQDLESKKSLNHTGSRYTETPKKSTRETRQREPELNLITDSFKDYKSRETNRSGRYEETSGSKVQKTKTKSASSSREKGSYRAQDRRKSKKKTKIVVIILELVVLLGLLTFTAYSYLNQKLNMMQRLPWNPDEIKNVEISEAKQEQMKGYWTIAVFGVDSRSSSVGKGSNSDVIMLCNINQDTGEFNLVSVFRDTYLNISDKNTYNKINAAYLQGGPEQTVKALNKNLDIDIDDYVTFNWKAVADAINILGGVDVELSKAEFYYINAFITETVKVTGIPSTPLKKAGMNHLDGVQAVAYGRLRLMDTDYARTERQRKIISLAFDKAKTADWATLNNIIQTVFPQVATSVELNDVLGMGRNIKKLHLGETSGFPTSRGDKKMGKKGACVIPKTLESNVVELHKFLFGDEDYETTELVRAISQKIAADAGGVKSGTPNKESGTKVTTLPKESQTKERETTKASDLSEAETKESRPAYESSGNHSETKGSSIATRPSSEGRPERESSSWKQWETDAYGNWYDPTRETHGGNTSRPGTGETSGVPVKPGNQEPTTQSFESFPGVKTDTGMIVAPGKGNTGKIEFTGPTMGP